MFHCPGVELHRTATYCDGGTATVAFDITVHNTNQVTIATDLANSW